MIYLTAEDLLVVARRVVGDLVVRDLGLVESAAARPSTQIGGTDAYPDLLTQAAALLHSLARNHALPDGNTRLALAGTIVFWASTAPGSSPRTTTPTTSSWTSLPR